MGAVNVRPALLLLRIPDRWDFPVRISLALHVRVPFTSLGGTHGRWLLLQTLRPPPVVMPWASALPRVAVGNFTTVCRSYLWSPLRRCAQTPANIKESEEVGWVRSQSSHRTLT